MKRLTSTEAFAIAASLALTAAGCSGAPEGAPTDTRIESTSEALTGADAVARGEEWVAAQVPYCQSANHQADPDTACASVCTRPDNPQWDPYRSDCSGFVSWAWGLPAPGRATFEFAPAVTDITQAIDAAMLQPGDAVNIPHDHMMLFKAWITPGQRATFLEEPGCSSSTPYAKEFDSDVTLSGTQITVAYEGKTFTAIHWDALDAGGSAPPDAGGDAGTPAIDAGGGVQQEDAGPGGNDSGAGLGNPPPGDPDAGGGGSGEVPPPSGPSATGNESMSSTAGGCSLAVSGRSGGGGDMLLLGAMLMAFRRRRRPPA